MRKRRNLIVALLLVVAMVAGIGYAALSKDLPITGGAELSKDKVDWAVVYKSANVTSIKVNGATADPTDTTLAEAGPSAGVADSASYTIKGLAQEDDFVVFEYIIENQSEAIANLGTITSVLGSCTGGDTKKYFTTKVEIKRGDSGSYQELALDSCSATVTPTIKLQPYNTTGSDDELHIQVTVTLNQTVGVEAGTDDDTITLTGAKVNFNFTSDVAP